MPDPIDNQELFSNPIEGLFPEVDDQEVHPEHPEFPEPEPEKPEKNAKEKKEEPKPEAEPEPEKPEPEKEPEPEEEEIDFDETKLTDLFMASLEDKFGWEIPEEERPKTVEEFKQFWSDIVEKSSVPQYASDEARDFDEYVRNGGTKDGFFQTYQKRVELDNMNPKVEDDAVSVLKEFYAEKGFSSEKAARYIERIKAENSLEEEAADAITELKEIRDKEHKQNVEQQKQAETLRKQEIDKFVSDVEGTVKNVKSLFGVDLSSRDRAELLPYIFEVGKDGKTQQQRDFEMDPVGYSIITSYAYKNKDKFLKRLEDKATSGAYSRYQQKLKEMSETKKTKSTTTIQTGKDMDWLDKV